jgi:hypothetical protein
MNAEQFARKLDGILKRLDQLEATAHLNYNKGTYTPAYFGGTTAGTTTHTFQDGVWCRIGNVLIVRGQVAWSAATGTGNAQISLPFTPGLGNYAGACVLSGITFANSAPEVAVSAGNTFFTLASPLTNAGATTVQVEAAGNITFTIVFFL